MCNVLQRVEYLVVSKRTGLLSVVDKITCQMVDGERPFLSTSSQWIRQMTTLYESLPNPPKMCNREQTDFIRYVTILILRLLKIYIPLAVRPRLWVHLN